MTRTTLRSALLAALFLCLGPALALAQADEAEERFVGESSDIPVMPGLVEDAQQRVLFDKAAGRILEARLSGAVGLAAAMDYYRSALTSLDWRKVEDKMLAGTGRLIFRRGDERLVLEFHAADGGIAVTVSLGPR